MHYTDDRSHLRVEIHEKECRIPEDERARMQSSLGRLSESVRDFPSSDLTLKVIHHPRSGAYHVEARLRVPGRTLFSGDQDAYLDTAFQRCLRKLVQHVEAYRADPNRAAQEQARRRDALDNNIVAPEDPADGVLGRAVTAGDYRRFRTALAGYEDWIRTRVGRWIQRYPEAEARVGDGLLIGDLVEEVYLNAFERFTKRRQEVRLRDWLDGLIDLSLKMLMKRPDEERENASLARTLRDTPL
jgi:ribosome-associated translation inhibitor RaiA